MLIVIVLNVKVIQMYMFNVKLKMSNVKLSNVEQVNYFWLLFNQYYQRFEVKLDVYININLRSHAYLFLDIYDRSIID